MAENTFISKILFCHFQKTPQILYKSIEQNALFVIHKNRNIIQTACLFKGIGIHIHIRGDYRNLPVAKPFLPHQPADALRDIPGFSSGISGFMKSNRILLICKCFSRIPEQFRFQKGHSGIVPEPPHRFSVKIHRILRLRPCFLCRFHQGNRHLLAHGKHLIRMAADKGIFPFIHLHRNHYLFTHFQQFSHETVLHRRKSGKTVKRYSTSPQNPGKRHGVAEHIQHFLFGNVFFTQIILKFLINFPDIFQFIVQITFRIQGIHKFIQPVKINPVLGKFRNHGLYLTDIALFLQIAFQHRKLFFALSGNPPEHQILSFIVKHGPVVLPQLLKNPVRQSSETQDIHIHDSSSGVSHAQIFLGLHGKLLGHKNKIILLRMPHCFFHNIMI